MNTHDARYRFPTCDFLRAKHAGPMIAATVTLVVEASINLADDEEWEKAEQNLRCISALQCPGHYSQAN